MEDIDEEEMENTVHCIRGHVCDHVIRSFHFGLFKSVNYSSF